MLSFEEKEHLRFYVIAFLLNTHEKWTRWKRKKGKTLSGCAFGDKTKKKTRQRKIGKEGC